MTAQQAHEILAAIELMDQHLAGVAVVVVGLLFLTLGILLHQSGRPWE
jgi:hypothetical protein